MNWITRFLPGLPGALGALLNPWVLLGLLAALVASYLAGLREGHQQLEQYQAAVAAVGKAAEQRRALQIDAQKRITQETDDAWKKRKADDEAKHGRIVAGLRGDLERMRNDARSRIVSPVPDAPGGGKGGTLCLERNQLSRGMVAALERLHDRESANMGRLLEGSATVLQRGDHRATAFLACATWVLEQERAGRPAP